MDICPKTYSVEQIARSYQATHVSIWNMPSDDELVHALKINGHPPSLLDALKDEYCKVSRAVCDW